MKKILALFLTFSMLLSLLTMPTVASGEVVLNEPTPASATALPTPKRVVPSIAANATTVAYDDGTGEKNYTVIWNVDDFYTIKSGSSKSALNYYILADNIDFSGKGTITNAGYIQADGNFVLEGNGYSINNLKLGYTSGAGKGMFLSLAADTTTKIRNLTINASGTMTANSTAVLFGTSTASTTTFVYIEGVTINAEGLTCTTASGHAASVFFAKPRCNVYLKDCVANGFQSTSPSHYQGVAAFVGRIDEYGVENIVVDFDNCHAIGTYNYSNAPTGEGNDTLDDRIGAHAIFVGYANIVCQINFRDCSVQNASLTIKTPRSGAFVGYNAKGNITFEDCSLIGNYSFETKYTGGFVGYNTGASLSINNCTISGANTFSGESTGGFVGYIKGGTVTFANSCVSSNNTYSASYTGGFVGYVNGGTVAFTSSGVSSNNTYSASCTGGFIGLQDGGTASINNCTVSGNQTFTKGKSAGFVGDNRAPLSFTGCSITGKLDSTEAQVGGYIGCSEYNNGDTNLTSCTADVTVTTTNNRVSPFVGQAYSNGTVNFNQCKVSGRFMSSAQWNGGFMGVAGGSYNTTKKTAKVNFTGCDADIFMIGSSSVASYVGSNGGGNPTITFDACKNNATVYALSSAGSWIAYPNSGDANATLVFKNACQNNAKLYSNSIFNKAGLYVEAAAWEKAADPEIANGAFAYEIAQAQKAIGITDPDYLYGQKIGTDATPVMGGETVYKLPLPQTDPVYSNVPVFENYYLVETEDVYYHQREDLGDKSNHRIIIPIQEDKMISLASLEVEVVYTLKSGKTKTLRVNQDQLSCFCAVYAGDQIAMAPEGYLLLALTVNNIPKSEWDGGAFTVEVTETPLDSALTLKFASYNIYQSRYDKEAGKEMQNIAKVILDNGLEVIGLQEVDKNTERAPFDVLQKLKDATGYYGAYFKAMDHLGGEYGDAILSKYEIVETKSWILEAPDGGEPRSLGLAVINVNGVKINFFVTHLCHVSDANRKAQLQQIAAILSEYDNYVLTGDFNTDNFSLFSEIEGSKMVNNENFSIVTFPNNYYSIDNIVYSPESWRFGLPHTIKESYSDHYALYATGVFMK